MPKTSNLPTISQQMRRHTQHEARDHQREWERHVDAGRIGSGSQMTGEQRAQLARNEMILCGYRVLPNHDSTGADASTRYC
ncbi:hypothetical protein [Erythrobacter rubeus]|uniref:Uncharacterized protein n=1 Tax=Erythrobacter rubeus TaxID=2760803 RepID=A0ABR8KQY2_9SPHN|nr:hypothetical protein [Erythrobacter rubeus]MBD2841473.1 hypothetical protein [Erythrobacter rubeus]